MITKNASSVDDTWVAMNDKDADLFADIRHALPELVNDIYRKYGFKKLSTDIAVPDDKFDQLMDFYSESFRGENLDHVIFGHIGESHVHVNMLPKSVDEVKRSGDLSLEFIKKGLALGGTVSAEHGIGKLKHKYLEEMYLRQGVLEMARLKKAFDPNCILGLDNIFPKVYLSLV